jgi:hypothetical protein
MTSASAWDGCKARDAVFKAVCTKDVGALHAAISGGFPVTAVDCDGETLLHYAAGHFVGLVPLLLEHGWDVNAKDKDGVTPLHVACLNGHLHTVQVLVQAGACLKTSDDHGWTVAHYAASGCQMVFDLDEALGRLQLFEWLATRPEVDWCEKADMDSTDTVFDMLYEVPYIVHESQSVSKRYIDIMWGAVAAQRAREGARKARWTPLRAAFVGAAVFVCEQ